MSASATEPQSTWSTRRVLLTATEVEGNVTVQLYVSNNKHRIVLPAITSHRPLDQVLAYVIADNLAAMPTAGGVPALTLIALSDASIGILGELLDNSGEHLIQLLGELNHKPHRQARLEFTLNPKANQTFTERLQLRISEAHDQHRPVGRWVLLDQWLRAQVSGGSTTRSCTT